jgi:MoaA/NifB/PqqE/SkfB family radical SAM enzyme
LEVIDQAFDLGIRFVAWSGGDPILHPYWDDLLGYATDKGMRGCFLSSGMLSKAEVRRLLRYQEALDGICVHISTIDQNTHDRIHHNPKTLQARLQGYRNLLDAGYSPDKVTNIITLTKTSAERIEETIDFFVDEMGSQSICIAVFKGEGYGQTISEWEPGLSKINRAYHYRAQKLGEHWLKLGTIGTSFYYCRTAIAVTGGGDVLPCACCRELIAGSIYQENLGDILERRRDTLLFNHSIKGYCGDGECPNRELCFGCRANALRYPGDVTESDPKCFFNPAAQECCTGTV